MKRKEITENQFQKQMASKLLAYDRCCDDILRMLAALAMGTGGVEEKEVTARYKKAKGILHKAIEDAGDCIVEHTCGL